MPPMSRHASLSLFLLLLLLAYAAACAAGGTSGTSGMSGTVGVVAGSGGGESSGAGGASSSSAGATTASSASAATTSTGGGADYACEVKSAITHFCVLYENLTPEELTAEMSGCTTLAGTSGTSCPTANAIGTCTAQSLGVTGMTTFYSDGTTTAAEAEVSCETALGTWTPA